MNVLEMQKGVQQKLNAMEIPIISEDVLWYLNRAQEQYIADQYVFLRGKYTDNQDIQLYTNAQKAMENLRTILSTEEITGTPNLSDSPFYNNAKVVDLTTLTGTFYYYVRSQSKDDATPANLINNRLVEQENIQKYIQTKYNNPIFRDNLVVIEGTNLLVFYDNQTDAGVSSVYLTYIKEPKILSRTTDSDTETTTCQLPSHTHREIVNLATQLARQDRKDEVSRTQRQNFEG
jgi:hypothetical protein